MNNASKELATDAMRYNPSINTPTSTTPLNYAPRDMRGRRRRAIRRIVLAVLAIDIAFAAFYYRSEISLRARRIYWAHKCMTHVTPPGTVLEEGDPAAAQKLAAANSDYLLGIHEAYDPGPTLPYFAVYCPVELRKYDDTFVKSIFRLGYDQIITFLGERISPAGHHRLIVISWPDRISVTDNLKTTLILEPPGIFGNEPARHWTDVTMFSTSFMYVDLSPGVADPTDLSHISIKYQTVSDHDPTKHGTIDVYLRDDDTLDVKYSNPAATQP